EVTAMDRTEAIQRILKFASKTEGFASDSVSALLQLVVPPQVDSIFLTEEVVPSGEYVIVSGERPSRESDEPGRILVDVGLLSHDGWFVGISVYKRSIRSTEWRVEDLQEIGHALGETFWD